MIPSQARQTRNVTHKGRKVKLIKEEISTGYYDKEVLPMIPDKMLQILKYEGVVAIVTMGGDGPHIVNTWNSYITITRDEHLLIPVGGMIRTEANVEKNNNVLITLGSREVQGFRGPGAGFLIKGTAAFIKSGEQFDILKKRFSWARAVMEITILSATQTL